jgi:hypothetical protein
MHARDPVPFVGDRSKVTFKGTLNSLLASMDSPRRERHTGIFVDEGFNLCPLLRSKGCLIRWYEFVKFHDLPSSFLCLACSGSLLKHFLCLRLIIPTFTIMPYNASFHTVSMLAGQADQGPGGGR